MYICIYFVFTCFGNCIKLLKLTGIIGQHKEYNGLCHNQVVHLSWTNLTANYYYFFFSYEFRVFNWK